MNTSRGAILLSLNTSVSTLVCSITILLIPLRHHNYIYYIQHVVQPAQQHASKCANYKRTKCRSVYLAQQHTALNVTGPGKTGLIYTKYTYSYNSTYLLFCICYPKSVSLIEFLMDLGIYDDILDAIQIADKSYYILNSQNQVKFCM